MISGKTTWNDCEIFFPPMHQRFLRGAMEKWLAAYSWYAFNREVLNNQLVLYIKIRD